MIDIMSKADGGSKDYVYSIQDMRSAYEDKGVEKPNSESGVVRAATENKKNTKEDILQILLQKQRILMEANTEKDKMLEQLEKEINDHNIQHREGICWLRLQLDTSRREKNVSDERIAKLHKLVRRLSSDKSPRNTNLDPTITDSVGDGDEKDKLITRLQSRVEKYESTFGVMENQIALIESSSGETIKTLKEEIANLMENRTRAELDLLNQLSQLDNDNRRRQLEYALELHNKDETIETIRNLESCSMIDKIPQIPSSSTLIYDGSSSTENTKSSAIVSDKLPNDQTKDLPTSGIRNGKGQSSPALRLEEEKAELQRKLDNANKELKDLRLDLNVKGSSGLLKKKLEDLRLGLKVKDNLEMVQHQASKERRFTKMSIDRVKAVLRSTNTAISKLNGLIVKFETDDDSGAEREKNRMLSVLESASLVHEEVKLSILLTEFRLRNEFECLKKNLLTNEADNQATPDKQGLINELKNLHNDALIELGKAQAGFSRQIKDLEKRTMLEKSKLVDMLKKVPHNRAKKHSSKSSKSRKISVTDGLQALLSSCQADRDSGGGSVATDDKLMISRDFLQLLKKELLKFAERIRAKNENIVLLKEEIERCKTRQNRIRKDVRESIKIDVNLNRSRTKSSEDTSIKYHKVVNAISEINRDEKTDTVFPKDIPREIHTTMKGKHISSVREPRESFLSDQKSFNTKLIREISRPRKGMSDDSQEGGTNPIAPIHLLTPDNRLDSIGFVPSPPSTSKNISSNSTSPSNTTELDNRRLQPTSREIKKLVFLPPCFFSDLG